MGQRYRWFDRGTTAFHPDLKALSRVLPRGPIGHRTLPIIRRLTSLAVRERRPGVTTVQVGAASVRWFDPPSGRPTAPGPAMLWIHGGGYVMGVAAQDDALCRRLAKRHGMPVASVDYRVAPEHPYPEPLEDCHDALVWLANHADVDSDRIAIGGASAGGGLAAGLAQLAVARGVVRPACQILVYPMLDDRTALRDDLDERNFRLWNNASNRFGWTAYTGRPPGSPDLSAPAVPARADDLSDLPPAWIGVGSLDLFRDEDVAYAERLRAAGVDCELEVVEGAFHGFEAMVPKSAVSAAFWASQDAVIERAVGLAAVGE